MPFIQIAAVMSALHLLALALGLPSVVLRGRALQGPLDQAGLSRLFRADTLWGVAAVAWLSTGLLRVFAGLEKGSQFYLASPLFWIKMTLFVAILALEVWPMTTFIRWRIAQRRGQALNRAIAGRLYRVNQLQVALVVIMVFVASFMARGVWRG